jgi:hypothetical protein
MAGKPQHPVPNVARLLLSPGARSAARPLPGCGNQEAEDNGMSVGASCVHRVVTRVETVRATTRHDIDPEASDRNVGRDKESN